MKNKFKNIFIATVILVLFLAYILWKSINLSVTDDAFTVTATTTHEVIPEQNTATTTTQTTETKTTVYVPVNVPPKVEVRYITATTTSNSTTTPPATVINNYAPTQSTSQTATTPPPSNQTPPPAPQPQPIIQVPLTPILDTTSEFINLIL